MNNYTVIHLHSDLSSGITNIDSVTKYSQYIDYAKSLGMKALAFSEHGSVFSWVKKKDAIEAAGMKYIHAEEFYVTKTIDEKVRDNWHCLLIALNYEGVKELNALSSKSFNREDGHFYYVPRITFNELLSTSNNIIISTACLGGILVHADDDIRKRFIRFLAENNERCYLEIQHHNVEDQIKYNRYLYELSQKYNIPLIAMTDTHALNEEHLLGRSILQQSKNIHFENEDGWDLTFKTYDELVEAYKKQNALSMDIVLEAIENTNKLADRVEEFTLDKSYKYPHLWEDSEKLFIKKIKEGIKRRGVDKYPNREEYADRIRYEMKAYKHNGAIDFMLLMEDIVSWCRDNDIGIGYGRGSVNGSIIAWLLGITEMDSIKHKLNFDRFMNIERVSLSDIDTDFPPSRIEEVKQYVFNHPGLYCSDIITFNTIADKGAIRDVVRALYKGHNERSKLSPEMQKEYDEYYARIEGHDSRDMDVSMPSHLQKAIDEANGGNYLTITNDVLALFEQSEDDARQKYPEIFKYVDMVKGTIISCGNHPCFTKDALVLTDLGYKTIDEIKPGDKVLTHNKRYKEVNDVIVTDNNSNFYEIKTGLLNIKATGNHPFYIRKPNKIRFRGNDFINSEVKTYDTPKWVNAEDIKRGDMLGMPINNNSIIPNEKKYASLNFESNDFWWIIGRYIGDGWITHNSNRNTRYLVICCDHDSSELSEILTKIKKESFEYRVEDREETYRIYIKNMDLLEYLERFGKYADGKYLTNDVMDLPLEQLRSFIRGYMSADGSYVKRDNIYTFSTVSKKLALGLSMCIAKVYMIPITCTVIPAHEEVLLGRTVNCKEKYKCNFHLDKRKKERNLYENGYVWLYCYGSEHVEGVEKTYNLSVYDDNSYTVNNIAVHNCGMIVSPTPLDDEIGLCTTSTDTCAISQIYMKEIDSLNYVKLDLLKLDTIELINNTCKLAGIERCTPDNLDITDVDVWNSMRDDTTAIFQWEGRTGDDYIKKLLSDKNIEKFKEVDENIDRMTLLSIGNSAIRPAGASYRDDLANGIVRESGSEAIDDFLKPTFGYLVFQCQIIEFLHEYCGFTMGEADVVRRHFAKKTGTEEDIPRIKAGFIDTMKDKYHMSTEEAEKSIVAFLQVIEDASNYLFSINHSQPYSYEGYACGWLRYYYPVEFLTCALNINKDNDDKTKALTNYANKVGIKIMPIKFRHSTFEYTGDTKNKCIYKAISSIKHMNDKLSQELYRLRDKQYDSFINLLVDIGQTSCDSRQLGILIDLGFFDEFGHPNQLNKQVEMFNKFYGRKQIKKNSIEGYPEWVFEKHCDKSSDKMYKFSDTLPMLIELCSTVDYPKTTIKNRIQSELEHLGYIQTTLENISDEYYYVNGINGNWLTLYQLHTGNTIKIKSRKKYLQDTDIDVNKIIKIIEIKDEQKWCKDAMGEWYRSDETEPILTRFLVLK